MSGFRLGLMLMLAAIVSACSGGGEALPTLVPVEVTPPTAEATATEAVPVEPTPTSTPVRARPTLPPTFTPTPTPTEEPLPTRAFPTATPFISAATPDPNCALFTVNFEASTTQFTVGESPRIAWNGIPGAELYRIIIRTENERVVTDQIYIAETSYQLPPNLFTAGVAYGWEVYPINARSDQMCFSIGSILIPTAPLTIPSGGDR
ncbi:hypothetical protein VZO05_05885 [Aggregatilineales bacterium SYSU G02658]